MTRFPEGPVSPQSPCTQMALRCHVGVVRDTERRCLRPSEDLRKFYLEHRDAGWPRLTRASAPRVLQGGKEGVAEGETLVRGPARHIGRAACMFLSQRVLLFPERGYFPLGLRKWPSSQGLGGLANFQSYRCHIWDPRSWLSLQASTQDQLF